MTARISAALSLLVLSFSAPSIASASVESLRLEADAVENVLYVYDGEEQIKSYKISVGTDDHPTPKGTFEIRRMIWNPRWVPPPTAKWAKGKTAKEPHDPDNPMKKVKIFFKEPDYYIHGTAATHKLGQPASHGCIRMDPEEAGELAQMIMKASGAPQDESWIRRILRLGRPRSINLPATVEFTVR